MVRDYTPWCNPSELKKGNFMQWDFFTEFEICEIFSLPREVV
jgi:hypothetical protein